MWDAMGRTVTPSAGAGVEGNQREVRIVSGVATRSIPLPPAGSAIGMPPGESNGAAALVAGFVAATAALSVDAAAQLAGVRVETLRKWRRRPPRWIKAGTARRLAAHLAGEPPAAPRADDGFRRAFHLRLRDAPPE